jgi:hypothetical protein
MLDPWEFSTESLAPFPTSVLQGRFSISPPHPLLVLDYSSLFMFFSFAGGGSSVCLGAVLDYYPREWVGELHMVNYAHLFFCSFTQATLEPAGGEKLPPFIQCDVMKRSFPWARGLGCYRVWFWLMFCLLLVGRIKKKKKKWLRAFSPRAGGWTCLPGCPVQDFCSY